MPRLRENIVFGEGQCHRLLKWNDGGDFVNIVYSPSRNVKIPSHGANWHYHSALELAFIQHGSSSCFVADTLRAFSSGELFVIGTDVPHYWHHSRNCAGMAIQWEFPAEHGIWDLGECAPLQAFQTRALCGLHARGDTARQVGRHMDEMVHLEGMERLCVFLNLLTRLSSPHNDDIHQLSEQPFDATVAYDHEVAIRRALSYIKANYRDPINQSDLLDLTGMSRSTFTRVFMRQVGMSFSSYLNYVRLEAVCHDLRSSMKPVSYIALDRGFTQISFFNRLFHRELGCSPTVYRSNSMVPPFEFPAGVRGGTLSG